MMTNEFLSVFCPSSIKQKLSSEIMVAKHSCWFLRMRIAKRERKIRITGGKVVSKETFDPDIEELPNRKK